MSDIANNNQDGRRTHTPAAAAAVDGRQSGNRTPANAPAEVDQNGRQSNSRTPAAAAAVDGRQSGNRTPANAPAEVDQNGRQSNSRTPAAAAAVDGRQSGNRTPANAPAEVDHNGRQSNSRTPAAAAAAVSQNGNRTPVAAAASQNGNRTPARQNSNNVTASNLSIRGDDDGNNYKPPSFNLDTSRSYSIQDRELINKSRNGFVGTVYISDVKQYFDHTSFDGNVLETNKKYLEDLLSDFRKLLKTTLDDPNDTLHDIEFVENDGSKRALPGHQQLLTARSATFEALFKRFDNGEDEYLGFRLLSRSDDGRVKRILLPQEDPRLTWELMEGALHYMYWGNIEERLTSQEDKLREFFEVASFLDLKELRRHLAQELYDHLKARASPKLAIEYLKLSVKCGCKYLKKEVITYIVRYKNAILKDASWNKFILEKESKELVKEIYQSMVQNTKE